MPSKRGRPRPQDLQGALIVREGLAGLLQLGGEIPRLMWLMPSERRLPSSRWIPRAAWCSRARLEQPERLLEHAQVGQRDALVAPVSRGRWISSARL